MLTGPTARKGVVAVVDQGLLSATNFFTGFMLARLCTKEEFGAYVLAFSVMLAVNGLQAALITGPMTVLGAGKEGNDWKGYATTLAVAQLVFGVGMTAIAFGVSILLKVTGVIGGTLTGALLAMSGALFFVQGQEFCRRVLFTRLKTWRVLLNDVVYCTLQIGGIAALWRVGGGTWGVGASEATAGYLDGRNVFYLMAASTCVGTLVGLWQVAGDVSQRARMMSGHLRESWAYGKWGLASTGVSMAYVQGMYLVLGAIGGVEAVAQFEGPRLLIAPCVLLLTAWGNIAMPVAAKRAKQQGLRFGLMFLLKMSLSLMFLIAAYICILLFTPSRVLGLVLGVKYSGATAILLVWCLVAITMCVATCISVTFYLIGHPELGFTSRLVAVCIGIPLLFILVSIQGALGGVLARLIVETVQLAAIAYLAILWVRRTLGKRCIVQPLL